MLGCIQPRGLHSNRRGHRLLDAQEPAGVSVKPHQRAGGRLREQRIAFLADDHVARVRWVRPLRHPLQTKSAVQTVQVRHARQQTVGMLAHEIAEAAVMKFKNSGAERGMVRRARALAGELTEGAIDDGQSGSI